MTRNRRLSAIAGGLLILATLGIVLSRVQPSSPSAQAEAIPGKAAPASASEPLPTTPDSVEPDQVPLRPLPVSLTSASHEWTSGDASDPATIEKLAHNPDEAIRMIEENDRIHRRQLVYRNETAAAVVRQAMAKGEKVRQLTLPGIDGQELDFVIERADLAPSGQTGTFTGHLAGKPNSQVSLGYKFGREAFTVISPDDNLYLQADPREPGELIVKAIDPRTYIQGTCGNPDHDH